MIDRLKVSTANVILVLIFVLSTILLARLVWLLFSGLGGGPDLSEHSMSVALLLWFLRSGLATHLASIALALWILYACRSARPEQREESSLGTLIAVLASIQLVGLLWLLNTGPGGKLELAAYLISVALALLILLMYPGVLGNLI